MSIIDSIITWANADLPDWQREAVRRLLTQESLSSEDHEHLYDLCKKGHSLLEADKELPVPGKLKKEEILGTSDASQAIILKRIQGIKNVNAIPDNSELYFAHKGLTVIYGENGAGKSGYARILKKACFARHDKEIIHRNIFKLNLTGHAEATFKLGLDLQEEFFKWTDGQQRQAVLANICVFDSKCARVIIDEKNEASYLPYGADVFQKLAAIVQEFKTKLEKEKPSPLKPEISDLPESTKAGVFFKGLNAKTKYEDLAQWFQWSQQDDDALNQMNINYAKAQIGDTTKQIRALENINTRFEAFKDKFTEYVGLVSPESIKSINQLIESRNAFQKAFDIVSKKPDGPLLGIATDKWQALYWAAKDYSTKQAYPGEEFPVAGEGKKCVLCMQSLSEDANSRLHKFHEYMENTAKKSLDDTTKKLAEAIDRVKNTDFKKFCKTDYKDVLDEIENRDNGFNKNIEQVISRFADIRNALIKAESDKTSCSEDGYNYDFSVIEKFPGIISSEIKNCQQNSDPLKLEQLKTALTELKAKKKFAENKAAITAYIESLKKLELYENTIRNLNTRGITDKGSGLIKDALTPQLMKVLSNELEFLGASYLPLNLKHSGSAGKNLHQMKIDGVANEDVKLTEILSEGEQEVIAIAGFLAELNLQDKSAPIVFDDPVSSLDHKFSEKIAKRLVVESAKRQVIIFTHDISFLLDLQEKSEAQGRYCYCINVCREGSAVGITQSEEPWHAMPVNKRLNFIDQQITKIASLYQTNQQEYNKQAGILYDYLRQTWEAAIEEYLFNKVVQRFHAEVKTQRLNEVVIGKSDYDAIDEGMSKCSKWFLGHDLSKKIVDNRPAPSELQEDVKKLKDFVSIINTRRKTTKVMRQITAPGIG